MTPEVLAAALADRYRLERELGAGGMATVYLAEDVRHHRKVALKLLREEIGSSLGAERFQREIAIAANLTHPHIVPLHDSGEAAGRLFYVMPYVEGTTLRERLQHDGELPVAEAVRLLRDIADAMAYAHAHGVVHRDIKPENVMLTGRHALVADFGVAKAVGEATGSSTLTTVGVALGTPAYMAPEQATADPLTDHRADIYAFGVVAYELLTGRQPFTGNSPQQVLAAQVTRSAEPIAVARPSVPVPLAALVMRCLEKRPADRYQAADDLVRELEALQTPSGGTTPAAAIARRDDGVRRRWAIGGAVALVVVVGIATAVLLQRRPTAAARTVQRIAVLPFENRTGNAAHDQLGAMAADWVTRGLADARLMEVVPASVVTQAITAGRAKGTDALSAVLSSTQASRLVTGAYYAIGDSLRFEAELLDAATRTSVTGIRPTVALVPAVMGAIDSLRHRVLGAVAQEAGASISMRYAPPPSLAVYELIMRGEAGYEAARYGEMEKYFRQAFALDTTYALSGAGLANALWLVGRLEDADTVLRRVEALPLVAPQDQFLVKYLRAILDGNQQLAYELVKADSSNRGDGPMLVQLAISTMGAARPREALQLLERVDWNRPDVRSTPGLWVRQSEAWRLLGDDNRALQESQKARAVFPTDMFILRREAGLLAALGRDEELRGAKQAGRALPGYGALLLDVATEQWYRGDSLAGQGTAREALAWYALQPLADSARYRGQIRTARLMSGLEKERRLVALTRCDSPDVRCWGQRGVAAALLGDGAAAREIAAMVERLPLTPRLRRSEAALVLAQLHAALGEEERAVEDLRAAFASGLSWGLGARGPFRLFPRFRAHAGYRDLMRPKG